MIETLGTYSELHRPPGEVEEWITDPSTPVTPSYSRSTGLLVGGVVTADETPLGFARIVRPPGASRDPDAHTGFGVWAEGNLLTLRHGARSKHQTLPAADVPAAIDVYRHHLREAVPLMTPYSAPDRLSRVDASVTWRHDPAAASAALAQARCVLHTLASGRKRVATYGTEGSTLRLTKKSLLRVYDKTAETRHALRGTGTAPTTGEGILVRLEVQERGSTARRRYGDTLHHLSRTGADMARTAVETAAEPFARSLALEDPLAQGVRLVVLGASPSESLRLLGPMQLLARGGIPTLVGLGVSLGSAYRIRARLAELAAVQDDPDAVAAGERNWEALQDSLWDLAHAEYADDGDEDPS